MHILIFPPPSLEKFHGHKIQNWTQKPKLDKNQKTEPNSGLFFMCSYGIQFLWVQVSMRKTWARLNNFASLWLLMLSGTFARRNLVGLAQLLPCFSFIWSTAERMLENLHLWGWSPSKNSTYDYGDKEKFIVPKGVIGW